MRHERRGRLVVQVAEQQQHRVGARFPQRTHSPSAETKPFASSGIPVAARAARRSPTEPPKRSSTSTDIAAAPADSYARANAAGSASGRMSPADGDRRLNSAIAARPPAASASVDLIRSSCE